MKAERPELYAAVLAVLRGSSRAAVRRELSARRLARRAAMACVEFLCAGASRLHASAVDLGLKLTCDVRAKLLRCVSSAK